MKNKLIIIYLIIINFLGIMSMFYDKHKARKGQWRIKESSLLLIAFMGGSLGSYIGMKLFRHKTKHIKFKILIPSFLALQIIFIIFVKIKVV